MNNEYELGDHGEKLSKPEIRSLLLQQSLFDNLQQYIEEYDLSIDEASPFHKSEIFFLEKNVNILLKIFLKENKMTLEQSTNPNIVTINHMLQNNFCRDFYLRYCAIQLWLLKSILTTININKRDKYIEAADQRLDILSRSDCRYGWSVNFHDKSLYDQIVDELDKIIPLAITLYENKEHGKKPIL